MDVSDARKLKVSEDKNTKLKRLLAGQLPDNTMLHAEGCTFKKGVTPAARRDAVAHLQRHHGVSEELDPEDSHENSGSGKFCHIEVD